MFTNLFFILLVLTLVNFVPDLGPAIWTIPAEQAFAWGIIAYFGILMLILLQIKWGINRSRLQAIFSILISIELLSFLVFYHFVLGAQRQLTQGIFSSLQTPFVCFSLLLYLFGLGWSYMWYNYFSAYNSFKGSLKTAIDQLLFLCPFFLPFLLFSFLFDLLDTIPFWHSWIQAPDSFSHSLFLIGLSVILLISSLAFMPFLLIFFWRCKPLEPTLLTYRLEKICATLHFKHAGMRTWEIMKRSFTAGIIGIFPFSRYVMFTPALLAHFKPEEIEAILIHEIGHNRYKHLMIYPFILMGMMFTSTAIIIELEHFLSPYLSAFSPLLRLETGQIVLTILLFTCYALFLGLYFRFIFGFFSRLFERQADLYIFESTLSPLYMIQALDHIGIATGYTHHQPSWHHFSIQKRILFLQAALHSPQLINQHHQKVKIYLWLYFIIFGMGSIFFFY